jgi:hypothetical protein
MPVNVIAHGQTVEVTSDSYEIGVSTGILPITDIYCGAYEITPSAAPQTLETARLMMRENVVVNPIPSNYGLITWNGATLTVS